MVRAVNYRLAASRSASTLVAVAAVAATIGATSMAAAWVAAISDDAEVAARNWATRTPTMDSQRPSASPRALAETLMMLASDGFGVREQRVYMGVAQADIGQEASR